jgi:hypothetical protein
VKLRLMGLLAAAFLVAIPVVLFVGAAGERHCIEAPVPCQPSSTFPPWAILSALAASVVCIGLALVAWVSARRRGR